jgi:hypothetical protein
MDLKLLGT